jgi:hypothetical protein
VTRGRRPLALLAVAALTGGLGVLQASASTPSSSTLSAPSSPGSVAASWTGTIPPGSNPQSTCATPGTDDQHTVKLVVPPAANRLQRRIAFAITWVATGSETVHDQVLTVLGPDGQDAGDSDGGSTTETVVINDPKVGTYTAVACGFANVSPQAYKGTARLAVAEQPRTASLPTVDNGLGFGPSTPSDVQRDIGEPAVTTDREHLHLWPVGLLQRR